MEGSFSPIVRKVAGEVVSKTRQSYSPTDVCLEDWWLSKSDKGKGIAVSGRPVEMRRCDNAQKEFHSAPTRKRYASREFHSAQIVKRQSCTTVETSDVLSINLCGFINRSRTQKNGFSSEVCRDFLYGFPFNWEDYDTRCLGGKSSESKEGYVLDSFLPASLDAYNGAQLHDMVLSLTDAELETLNKNMYDNLMGRLNPEIMNEISAQPSKSSTSSVDRDMVSPHSILTKVKNKQQVGAFSVSNTSVARESVAAMSTRKRVCRTATNVNNCRDCETVNISPKASIKKGPVEEPAKGIIRSRKSDFANVEVSPPKASRKRKTVDKAVGVVRTSRSRVCKSKTYLKNSGTEAIVGASPKALQEESRSYGQSYVRQLLLESLTPRGKIPRGCHMLKQLLD